MYLYLCFCSIQLVESIPSDMTFPAGSPRHTSIVEAWCDLIQSAEETIDIAAFYWSLRDDDLKPYVNASHPVRDFYVNRSYFVNVSTIQRKKGNLL